MSRLSGILLSSLLCAAAILPGCSPGGGVVAGIDRGGLRGVYGPVSGFGSVVVNGVHYDTTSAAISVNGLPATEADLEVGYVVTIQADIPQDGTTPKAVSIDFGHNVIGPMSAVSVTGNRITVFGQEVVIDGSTSWGPGIVPASVDGLALLPAGTIMRVSGFVAADGSILATRIEVGAAGTDFEVTGIATNVDTAARTLQVGGLVVDYSAASLQNFPAGEPGNGNRIKAEGNSLDAGGALLANELKLDEIQLQGDAGDEGEVEGLITAFVSPAQFSVSGIAVSTDATTVFENGDATLLGPDIRIEAEGQLDGNGVLKAAKVTFSPEGSLHIEATVDSVNPLVVLGISIETDNLTSFEDASPAELRPFHLADINPGDPLRITGFESSTTPDTVHATGITRTEPLEELQLTGIAENVVAPGFSILGVPVITDGNTSLEPDFFATAQGRLVEVEGSTTGGSFLAQKVEFKD